MKLTKSQLKEMIREELQYLQEDKKILKAGFQLTHLGKGRYSLEYSKFNWEPDISELQKKEKELLDEFGRINDELELSIKNKKPTIYVRDNDVAIGITVTSKKSFSDLYDNYQDINTRD